MIGIFGGTFNPIHFGHINLALELKEKCKLKEVWVIPAHISPLKNELPIEVEYRKKMIELAIRDIPGFFLNDIELKRSPPSYTVDTLRELRKISNEKFALLLGEDAALDFDRWKEPLEIIKMAVLLIGCRGQIALLKKIQNKNIHPEIKLALENGLVTTPILDIDATRIRKRIQEHEYCGHLVPQGALDIIYANQLYYSA